MSMATASNPSLFPFVCAFPCVTISVFLRAARRFYSSPEHPFIRRTATPGKSAEGRRGRLNCSASVRTGGYIFWLRLRRAASSTVRFEISGPGAGALPRPLNVCQQLRPHFEGFIG